MMEWIMVEEQSTTPQKPSDVVEVPVLDAHPDEIDNPNVSGYFTTLVTPDDSVSISFSIVPKDEAKAIGSITTGFFRSQGGVLLESIGGTNFTVSPATPGQKMNGGTSEKKTAFPPLPPGEVYEAVLQGALKKDGESAGSFFLTKVVQPNSPVA
jgi:hypothetical protein